jgi:hypothetical protein
MKNNSLSNINFQDLKKILDPIKCKCVQHEFTNQDGIITIYHSNEVPYLVMSEADFLEIKNFKI